MPEFIRLATFLTLRREAEEVLDRESVRTPEATIVTIRNAETSGLLLRLINETILLDGIVGDDRRDLDIVRDALKNKIIRKTGTSN
jgi:hypothetical protein